MTRNIRLLGKLLIKVFSVQLGSHASKTRKTTTKSETLQNSKSSSHTRHKANNRGSVRVEFIMRGRTNRKSHRESRGIAHNNDDDDKSKKGPKGWGKLFIVLLIVCMFVIFLCLISGDASLEDIENEALALERQYEKRAKSFLRGAEGKISFGEGEEGERGGGGKVVVGGSNAGTVITNGKLDNIDLAPLNLLAADEEEKEDKKLLMDPPQTPPKLPPSLSAAASMHTVSHTGNYVARETAEKMKNTSNDKCPLGIVALTYATHPGKDDRFCRALESAVHHKVDLRILGWGKPWTGLTQKLTGSLDYLRALPTSCIVVFTDAYDILYADDLNGIKAKFEKESEVNGHDVLFAGEVRTCVLMVATMMMNLFLIL